MDHAFSMWRPGLVEGSLPLRRCDVKRDLRFFEMLYAVQWYSMVLGGARQPHPVDI